MSASFTELLATGPGLVLEFGPESAGIELSPEEFDAAKFEEGYRYELIHGVLVVNPPPLLQERGPNDRLGQRISNYRDRRPQGEIYTAPEQTMVVGKQRRRADRAVWVGLGRAPKENEPPSIAIEFVSAGKRGARRDYETKRQEYQSIHIREYWVIDRFRRTMTVFLLNGTRRVLDEKQTYSTDLMPGFELPLTELFAEIDWLEA